MTRGFLPALLIATTLALTASRGVHAAPPDTSAAGDVKRGEYVVTIGSCNDCHTPWKMGAKGPEPDFTRRLSGHPAEMVMPPAPKPTGPWLWAGAATNTAFAGPWGVSYAINLTPDDASGLGKWTEAMFVEAMRTGKHAGVGRPILPPMPWPALAAMNDADLKAVFAYLRSIKPIKNMAPPAIVAPPPAP
jgi:mono/diheme cytochrome c family protein